MSSVHVGIGGQCWTPNSLRLWPQSSTTSQSLRRVTNKLSLKTGCHCCSKSFLGCNVLFFQKTVNLLLSFFLALLPLTSSALCTQNTTEPKKQVRRKAPCCSLDDLILLELFCLLERRFIAGPPHFAQSSLVGSRFPRSSHFPLHRNRKTQSR